MLYRCFPLRRNVFEDRADSMRGLTSILIALIGLCGARPTFAAELSSVATVHVREIKLEGDRLVDPRVFAEHVARLQDRDVSAEELLELAQQLTEHLIERGYVNSGVLLPDQKVDDGVIVLQVVAGKVGTVNVNGNRSLSDRYISSRIGALSDKPFNINDSVRRLQLLQRDPRIKKLDAELKPGVERGFALLNVEVEEQRPYGVSVGIDNHLSPNVGEYQATLDAYHLSVFGMGDALTLGYRYAEGFSGGSFGYALPVNAVGTTVSINAEYNESEIVSEPFAQLNIEGTSLNYGIALRQPLINTLRTEISLTVGVQKEHVESFLLGEPFSFSASDTDGEADVTMILFAQEWVHRDAKRVVAVRSTFNLGVTPAESSMTGEADGEFVEWLGQVEWLQKIDWLSSTLGLKLQLHLSNDTLPAFRKYALGGANSVRGYRENLITRDSGTLASLEWSVPVARWLVPWFSDGQADGEVTLVPFVDYGRGWDYFETLSEPIDIASVGLGAQWRIGRNSGIDLRYAKSLISREILTQDKVLQDDGVHFSVRVGF